MLTILSSLGFFSLMMGQTSVTWNLTTDANVSSSSGNITGQTQSLTNLSVPSSSGYTTNGQRTSAKSGGTDGTWIAETAENPSRYMQFAVGPNVNYDFQINALSLYLYVNSGSNMRANVYYSVDPTFASRTQIGSTLSLSSTAPTSPNININPGITVMSGQSLYLRVYPWNTGATTGKYVVTKIVTISGTASLAGAMITPSVSSLVGFTQTVGTPSLPQTYSLTAKGLTSNVVVTPPVGFEVSADGGSTWNTNASPCSLSINGDSIAGQPVTINVRLNSVSGGAYSGNIVHASVGVTSANVAVSGFALASEPTTQSSISFGEKTGNSIVVNLSGGNGSNRVVVARLGSAVSWTPTDGNAISGMSSNFTSATDQGSGNKVVYDGTGTSITVTGLTTNTSYYFAVYEYNVGTGNSQNYLLASPGTGNETTLSVATISVAPNSLSFDGVEINTISPEKTYTLSGAYLDPASGNITVTAPTGFEVSLTSGSGFSSSAEISYSGNTLAATTIFVRFLPSSTSGYSGNISNAGGGATTENVIVSGTGVEPGQQNMFEAEKGVLNSAYLSSQYGGYSGTGYAYIADKTDASLEIDFRRTAAATDTVRIYYANGGSSRTYTVYVNDGTVSTLAFPSTGSWTTWSSVIIMTPLQAGVNKLKFASTTNKSTPNFVNIDRIYVGGEAAIPVYKLILAKSGNGTVSASPDYLSTYYDAGTLVTITAAPSPGSMFYRWSGTDQSTSNPLVVTMNSHKKIIGVMPTSPGFGAFPYEAAPKGFASVGAFTCPNGTTGGFGAGSQTVYITTSDELSNLMLRRVDASHTLNFPPLVVYVIGTLTTGSTFSDMCDVKDVYDISIIGVGVDAKISGFGLKIVRSENIIVRNIKFENGTDDGINIQADDVEGTGDHVWIDHCDFTNCYDGALDVTHTVSYTTLSWNHFYKHDKTCLQGHSDSQTSDVAMKITWHHNYFDSTGQRHPRVRYGKAHVYNNYYKKNILYGVSSNDGADVLIEGSYFLNVPLPSDTSRDGSVPGDVVERNNIFVGCGAYQTRGDAFDPSTYYSYAVDDPATIPNLVETYSGSGKFDFSSSETPTTTQYQIISSAGTHGTISPLGTTNVYAGNNQMYTMTPASGYKVDSVFVDGGYVGSLSTYTFTSVMTNHTIAVTFAALPSYTITATAGPNGSISPAGVTSVISGGNQSYTMNPSAGYKVDSVFVDNVYVGSVLSYSFTSVTANHTIAVTFVALPTFTITATADTNGSITPSGITTVISGGSQSYIIAPHTGYHIAKVLVDGDSVGTMASYNFTNVTTNHSISASFVINKYTLTIVPDGSVIKVPNQALYDSNTTVQLIALLPGGTFSHWSGDLTGTTNPITVVMDANKNITANFGYPPVFMNQGWNLVSVPLAQSNDSASVIFSNKFGDMFAFSGGTYVQAPILTVGYGYWVYYTSAQSETITGSIQSTITVPLSQGWNLIGSREVSTNTSALTTIPANQLFGDVFAFAGGGYITTTTIAPGQGVWVYSLNACTLSFP